MSWSKSPAQITINLLEQIMIKNLVKSILLKINPTFKKVCHIEALLEAAPKQEQFSDIVVIDKDMYSTRHACYDFENVERTITKGESVLFIDIGANTGQSARLAYKFFSDVQVLSYEPLMSCLPALMAVKTLYSNFEYFNCALSDNCDGVVIKEIAGETGLSSSLDISDKYTYFGKSFNASVKSSYLVQSSTLTEEVKKWDTYNKAYKILKIDTQGTELSILSNGEELLKSGYFDVIMIEILTVEKYKNSFSCIEMMNFLDDCGFVIYNISPNYREFEHESVRPDMITYGHTTEFNFTLIHKKLLAK